MLGPGRYLLGVLEIVALAGFAGLGGWSVRRRFLPDLTGPIGGLASAVVALAILVWVAEVLGAFGVWTAGAYLVTVVVIGGGTWALWRAGPVAGGGGLRARSSSPPTPDTTRPRGVDVPTLIALAIAAVALVHFAGGVKTRLSTGMTGFDSTWYHGPFAAGFFQSGDTWGLHFIAPQFLAWFYPANSEVLHAAGMLAFGRDVLSPLLNLGWFVGCLFACWCIGRPYRVGAWSLGLGAIALSVPALADQAGEARNDIVGIFFLLVAVALALNAAVSRSAGRVGAEANATVGRAGGRTEAGGEVAGGPARRDDRARAGLTIAELAAAGLAAGLAAGTKLNFLLPAGILVVGLAALAPRGSRGRALLAATLGALAGGGYWYLRNLLHTGNPLPWIHHLGPIDLPAPAQALGGREAHSVLGYLTDGAVWSDWFLPGLHGGLWIVWPLLGAAALAGLVLAIPSLRCAFSPEGTAKEQRSREGAVESGAGGTPEPPPGQAVLGLAGLVGLAAALAWLVAPTSASGPEGVPRGFESGLRYLAPALVLGLALLPAVPLLRSRLASLGAGRGVRLHLVPDSGTNRNHAPGRCWFAAAAAVALLLAVAIGYPIQRHYLENRYAEPTFSAPGLDAAFAWARDVSGARIATTSTRQYPLFGTDLSNRVEFVGSERDNGGFEAPTTCRQWRRQLNAGDYDYVVTSRDRLEPGKPPYPETTRWTESPQAKPMLRKPPTVVFAITGRLDPSRCR
jgi:hypothetical protein